MSETQKFKGTCKFYSDAKGYGFIEAVEADRPYVTVDGEVKEVFVHKTALKNGQFLRPGVEVEFALFRTEKGFEAQDVFRINIVRKTARAEAVPIVKSDAPAAE